MHLHTTSSDSIKPAASRRCSACFLAILLALPLVGSALPPLPSIPSQTFNVTDYGAVGDGASTNTTAIQNAINAAGAAGGGTVEIPAAAGAYRSGPLVLANRVNLQIDAGAVLQMLPLNEYPGGTTSPQNFLTGSHLHDLEISGGGTIDGQGAAWWPYAHTNGAVRPNLINFSSCSTILMRDVTLSNSPSQNLVLKGQGGNITLTNLTITAPSSSDPINPSHNTDAIDLAQTNAVIEGCDIHVGDDNLAVGSSGSVSADILVTNCTFGVGHGVSIGSHTAGGVSNLTVINCTFNGTDNGIRLKSERGRGGLVQNLRYLNLQMTNVAWPFLIYSYYQYGLGTITTVTPAFAASEPGQSVTGTTPIWRDITFSNITATSSSTRPPLMIWGLPEMLVSNVTFVRVNLTSSSTRSPEIYNARHIEFVDSQIHPPDDTLLLYNAQLVLSNTAPSGVVFKLDGLTTNGIGNALELDLAQASVQNTNAIAGAPLALDAGTLSVGNNLSLDGAAPLYFALSTNQTSIAVSGSLGLGGAIQIGAGAGFTNGTYTLFTFGGGLHWANPTIANAPADYTYAFDTNTAGQVKLLVHPTPPPAPAGVSAEPTNSAVRLDWSPAPTAASYNVKRALTNNAAFTVIATHVFSTNYTDLMVTNGVTYFYVVSAVNAGGESPDSSVVSATPTPSLSAVALAVQSEIDQLDLSWPADHRGWRLEIQTNDNPTGLGTNWATVSGSEQTNQMLISVNPALGSVFLRLVYP